MSDNSSKTWICSVCGYVHHGAEAPEYCPVCGATKDLFELQESPPELLPRTASSQWRCLNCSYIMAGSQAPDICPVCGATAEQFESFVTEAKSDGHHEKKLKTVIVGAGIAGISAAEALRKASSAAEIILLSKETDIPYYRLNLTRYLAGEVSVEQLDLHPKSWYDEQNIELCCEAEATNIDLENKELALRDGSKLLFDKLILTIGSHPFVPPFPGVNRENVVSLRTKEDANKIQSICQKQAKCVCIGGGLLGLETAGALAKQGIDVTLLEGHGWLLPRQLNQTAAELLEKQVTAIGIKLRKNARTQELLGDEHVQGVLLEDGETIPADVVIITTGVRSNSYVARRAGLEVNRGVLVNDHLQSSHPDVYAAGDVAEHRGVLYGVWGPAQYQGTIAGMNAAGADHEFSGIPRSNMLKVLGGDLFSIGEVHPEDASYRVYEAAIDDKYFFFNFRDNYLVGAILLGDAELSANVKKIVEKQIDCSELLLTHPGLEEILHWLRD